MYRGLARLVGMDVMKTGATFPEAVATLAAHWETYDFFFVHYKDTDKAGEDGDFDALAEMAATHNRWEFMLTIGLMPFPNGTGSPVNPIAIF